MEFIINGDFSYELSHVSYRNAITFLQNEINIFFINKEYGEKINKIYCGIICVSKQFDDLFQPRPAKVLRKEPSLEFEYKLDFEIYLNANDEERVMYILKEYYNTIKNIFLMKKIKDFDYQAFLNDLDTFLSTQNLSINS
ncbi:hypothetical protein LV89_04964 [Arcicella aurantiaca]|uniref:Immunity protein 44 of polymorphic toxin system n=1 Tax=Arcicella aurantiaca TaxID=591202 RepID=A0A316DCP4_9BACT|nr:hypothetical protein [Arcicella aurantiaca]PWK15754.1 hypothetical protein LV89_04964 [Arcicella aurantiaca]